MTRPAIIAAAEVRRSVLADLDRLDQALTGATPDQLEEFARSAPTLGRALRAALTVGIQTADGTRPDDYMAAARLAITEGAAL